MIRDWHPNILLVDDDIDTLAAMRVNLRRTSDNWQTSFDETPSSAMQRLRGLEHAIVVSDRNMPSTDGPTFCRWARALEADPAHPLCALYFIILSGSTSKRAIVDALDVGADDYLTKPCAHDELLARIHVGERSCRAQYENVALTRSLEHATKYDELTGCHHRRPGRAIMGQLGQSSGGAPLTVGYIDIRDFRAINRSFGEECADTVLRTMAQRIRAELEDADILVRWAGDVFAFALADTTRELAHRRVSAWLRAIESDKEIRRDLGRGIQVRAGLETLEFSSVGPEILDTALTAAEDAWVAARELVVAPRIMHARNLPQVGAKVHIRRRLAPDSGRVDRLQSK